MTYVPALGMTYLDRSTGRKVKVVAHHADRPAAMCREGKRFSTVDYTDLVPVR